MQASKHSLIKGYLLLILTACIWGGTFVFQKRVTASVDPLTFNFVRFALSVPAIAMLFFLPRTLFQPKGKPVPSRRIPREVFIGIGAGVFMFGGISLQQWGLTFTDTGKTGFLTSFYIVFVPILAFLIMRERVGLKVWLGCLFCIAGLFFLAGGFTILEHFSLNFGDMIILISAIFWALHVFFLGVFARSSNILTLILCQSITVALLSFTGMAIAGTVLPSLSMLWDFKQELFVTAVLSSSIAFMLQIFGQRAVPLSQAAIIMSMESIFALLAGMWLLDERLDAFGFMGCLLIFIGTIIPQLVFKKKPRP